MADVKKIATRDSYGNALKELGASAANLVKAFFKVPVWVSSTTT